MKKINILLVALLFFILNGCSLVVSEDELETEEKDKLVGVFLSYDDAVTNFLDAEYLVLYQIEKYQNDMRFISTEGKSGFVDANIAQKTNGDTGSYETNFSTTVYISNEVLKFDLYLLYQAKDGSLYQKLDQENISVKNNQVYTYQKSFSINNEKINYSFFIDITFKTINKLEKVKVIEYGKNQEIISELLITEDKEITYPINTNTEYIVINEIFRDSNNELYNYSSLYNAKDIYSVKHYTLRFSNDYGFVSGKNLILSKEVL